MKLDGYIRVSRTGNRDTDEKTSAPFQRAEVTYWAKRAGVTIAEWHEDFDQSGGTMDRPGFERAMVRIRRGQTDGLVVSSLDRFARNLVGGLAAVHEIVEEHGAKVVFVAEGVDPTTAAGEAMLSMLLVMARFQHRQLTEGWQKTQKRAIDRGVHFRALFGYAKGPGQVLVAVPEEAALVRQAFELRAGGATWGDVCRMLDASGVTPRKGHVWSRSSLQAMFGSRAYLGTAFHGDHEHEGAHEAIIGEDLFEAVQGVKARTPARSEVPGLLAGLVRCAYCSFAMSPTGNGPKYRNYRCRGKHGSGACPSPTRISQPILDGLVIAEFFRHYKPSVEPVGRQTQAKVAQETEARAKRRYEAVRRAKDVLEPDEWLEDLAEAKRELVEARRERQGLGGALAIGSLEENFAELPFEHRQNILRQGVGAVFVRRSADERVRVLWPGEEPDDLPVRGRVTPPRAFDWTPVVLRARVA